LEGGFQVPGSVEDEMTDMVRVPSLINGDVRSAEQLTTDILLLQIAGKQESDEIPANMILKQDIEAGSEVLIHSVLRVFVSAGDDRIITEHDENFMMPVADVTYRTVESAVKILEMQALYPVIVKEPSAVFARNVVISQDVEAGTMAEIGTHITLTVSSGLPSDTIKRYSPFIDLQAETTKFHTYSRGDKFDPDAQGLIITVLYQDGTARDVTPMISVYDFDTSKIGDATARIRYKERGAFLDVYVWGWVFEDRVFFGMTITPPDKTMYSIGESLDLSGFAVTGEYHDGSTEDITHLVTLSDVDLSSPGLHEINVIYQAEHGMTFMHPFLVDVE